MSKKPMTTKAEAGIIFVLRSGIPWEMLPREFGCSGMTCWRRLRDWQTAGVWTTLHRVLLERLSNAGHLEWSRASLDIAAVAAKRGAETGPNPTDRGKPGLRRHLVVDRRGTPLGVRLSPANRHDSMMLAPTWMPCQACATVVDVRASALTSSTPTRPMTITAAGANAENAPSSPALPDAASTAAIDWADIAG